MGVFNIESKANKTIRTNVERNDGWRRAFGELDIYKEDSEFVLVDKDGTEKMRLELQDFYGQSDLSMGQKNEKWFYIDKDGKNKFDTYFDNTYSFFNGLAYVELEGERNAYINYEGKIVIGPFFINKKKIIYR
jgi:hypothetical protein